MRLRPTAAGAAPAQYQFFDVAVPRRTRTGNPVPDNPLMPTLAYFTPHRIDRLRVLDARDGRR